MAKFSERSKQRLETCHPLIQEIMNEAIKEYDFSVLCGVRDKEEQDRVFNQGYSKVQYPNSKHNKAPSIAIDIIPYPIDWNNIERFKDLSKIVLKIAEMLEIKLNWGGNWKSFKDYPHYELDKSMLD